MEPASTLIKLFGGTRAVADICGTTPARVRAWMQPVERDGKRLNGGNGRIPLRHTLRLLEHARLTGMQVVPSDFDPAPSSSRAPADCGGVEAA